jgi:hypothetical protein
MAMIASDARRLARELVSELTRRRPDLVHVETIELVPALEHGLFTALRDGRAASAGHHGPDWRGARARLAIRWLAARRHGKSKVSAADVVLLPSSTVHIEIWRPVAAALGAGGTSTGVAWPVRDGGCLHERDAACARAFLSWAWISRLSRHARAVWSARREIEGSWTLLAPRHAAPLAQLAIAALPRLALAAAQLDSMLRWIRPGVVVCYNEVGPLSRLAPAVAHGLGLHAVDLPHAEAADAPAIAGIDYDAVGVFGDRASTVMAEAGVARDRIVAIGAPHVDQLIAAAAEQPAVSGRRIVFASQSLGGAMSAAVKQRTLRAALAAAAAAAPVQLVIRPHPLETDDVTATMLEGPMPAGVEVTVEPDRVLAAHLAGAWALVTAWSNTAYEAAALGVPVIAINATGGPPVLPLAEESLALGAVDQPTAAAAARQLLVDATRDELVRAASERVRSHLGPLDGRSAERAAALILGHVQPQPGT